MKFKRRNCKLCGKPAMQNRAICWSCELGRRRTKREATIATKQARKAKKTEKWHNSLAYLKPIAWKLQSRAIRQSQANDDGLCQCYTCHKLILWQEAQLGHFKHDRLDFDTERNLRIQCTQCNKFAHGNLSVFAANLVKEGIDIVKLELDANAKVYTWQEVKDIIEKYK